MYNGSTNPRKRGRIMTKEDLIVLCEGAIDAIENKEGDYLGVALENLYEIRASLINEGESNG
jgi:hypothetical protein